MGYTTYFSGQFDVTPPLEPAQVAYLKKFNETRRMKRNAVTALAFPDPLRLAVNLPIGDEGSYFVGADTDAGYRDPSVIDVNKAPGDQPGLWCNWVPTDDGTAIVWDEGEKFYDYTAWIEYIVEHFLEPWGRKLNGAVIWSGEDDDDKGVIYAKDNQIEEVPSAIVNNGPSWNRTGK